MKAHRIEQKDSKLNRSPELKEYLKENFEDHRAYTERHSRAKDLKLTTPFVRAGFIDKKSLERDPNNVFEVLGLD